MPVVKIIPAKSGAARIEKYIKNPDKTNPDLYFGNLCDTENVKQSFKAWNQAYKKPLRRENRSYYHIIISWNTEKDNISPEECRKMTEELCSQTALQDYPYFGTVHTDTPNHLHIHLVVNNCSIQGKSYQSTRSSTRQLKQIANEICEREGFIHSLTDIDKKASVFLTTAEAQLILKKDVTPWKDRLRYQIDEVLKIAKSKDEFVRDLEQRYQVKVLENQKGEFRFLSPDSGKEAEKPKPCPAKRLGTKYSRMSMEKIFQENLERTFSRREVKHGIRR